MKREASLHTSSKGNQYKWLEDGYWHKLDYLGYESLVEIVVSKLLKRTNVKHFVPYYHEEVAYDEEVENACISENFLGEGEELITIERLIQQMKGVSISKLLVGKPLEEKITTLVEIVEEITGIEKFGMYLTLLLEVDAFFLNEDRHTHNIAVIRTKERRYKLCPIFDNGAGLFSDTNTDYQMGKSLDACYDSVEAKPFDRDFDEQMDAAEGIYGQQFWIEFSTREVEDALDELRDYYDNSTIERVLEILRIQYRKYEYFRN